MLFYPTEHNWMLTVRPYRIPLDECFPGRYSVNSLPTLGSRWPERDPHLPRKANGPNVVQGITVNPNHTSYNKCNKEEGKLFAAKEQQDTDLSSRLYMWTSKDKEEYQLSKSKGIQGW